MSLDQKDLPAEEKGFGTISILISRNRKVCQFEIVGNRNHSVTGGPEQVLLGPGGSGGMRRKHRPG
jgi:hypothetical protein